MPLTKEQFQSLRNRGLSTEQIIRFEHNDKSQQQIQPLSASENVENSIRSRKSFIDVNRPINTKSIIQSKGLDILRALGGGMEVAEGVPTDIGLGLQRAVETGGKSITQIPSDIGKTLIGERPAQFGDIFRGANVPEPLAATGGLLASASPLTPTGALGDILGKLIGKPIVAGYQASKPSISKALSFMSGTPTKSTRLALDNPKLLSNKYIRQFEKEAGEGIEREKKPLINDPSAIVKSTPKMTSIANDLGWYTPTGAYTAELSALQKAEREKLLNWANRIDNGQGEINFNEADKVIAEIDSSLGQFFKKSRQANIPPITEQFERQALHIRNVVNEARKSQFPKAGKAIDEYSRFAGERGAHRDFQRVRPRLQEAIGGGFGGVGIGLLLKSLPAGILGFGMTSPAVQGQLIKNIAKVAGNVASSPALTPMSLKSLAQRKKKDQSR